MGAVSGGHVGQRLDILGEAAAAIANASVKEVVTDALIVAHADGYLFHIGSQLLAYVGNLVDEGYTGGQKRIGGIFDHFSGAQIGDNDRRPQAEIEMGHLVSRFLVERAQNDPIGAHEVRDGRTLTQELRVGNHRKLCGLGLIGADDVGHPVTSTYRHRALVDDNHRVTHGARHCLGGGFDVLQVGLTVHPFRGADGDEHEFGVSQRFRVVGREGKPAGLRVAAHHFVQPGLVDRHTSLL